MKVSEQALRRWGGLLSARQAANLDLDLMAQPGFSLEQLMELAGLSVAAAIHHAYPPHSHKRLLCVCGPGNNGGDGLVAARHLFHFGYNTTVVYPKQSSRQHFVNLATQLQTLSIPIMDTMPPLPLQNAYDVVLDAVFGFSFKGDVRAPFDLILPAMRESRLPLVSVDIPSGWNVDQGPQDDEALRPQVLISLTAPKLCAQYFSGRHYLGGRFLPPLFAQKYSLNPPAYEGSSQFTLLDND